MSDNALGITILSLLVWAAIFLLADAVFRRNFLSVIGFILGAAGLGLLGWAMITR
jgi:hypothetical protein